MASQRLLALGTAALLSLAALPASGAPRALGLNAHQSTDVGLDAARDAHVGWVRLDFNWFNLEPSPGAYDFTLFDTLVDGAAARGLKVLAVLAYTPSWASAGDVKGDGSNNDVPVDGAYAAFVTAVVQHFQGKITHYELWNEPNLGDFFEGKPDDYVQRVLIPGADAVHAACPSCLVVAPGLASIAGEWDVWLDAALTAAKDKIDIVSGHDYGQFPVDSPGAGQTSDSFFNRLEQHRVLKVGETVVFEGPLSFREVMQKHGVTKPFWLTETGREGSTADVNALIAQKLYYQRVLEAMLTRPWWEATIFYEAFDEPGSGYAWGVVVHDPSAPSGYVEKPVFSLLKKAASVQPAFGGNGHDCGDGLDNDGDGLVDYPYDPGCSSKDGASEGLPPPDGGVAGGGTGGAGGSMMATGGGGAGGANTGAGGTSSGGAKGGCGCVVGDGGSVPAGAFAALGAAILAARRRRARCCG